MEAKEAFGEEQRAGGGRCRGGQGHNENWEALGETGAMWLCIKYLEEIW